MAKEILAFADEYGTSSFNFEKEGTHFIVAGVICERNDLQEMEDTLEKIRAKYFQKGEIKSNKVGDDHRRRMIILQEIVKLPFTVYALVVNKEKLFGEGFRYKASFYKYLNGILYKELFKAFPKLDLAVDEHGSNEFMKSFRKYVDAHHVSDLFSGSEFRTTDSSTSILIQLADFMAGTLARCFDPRKVGPHKEEFLNLLHPKLASVNHFPKPFQSYTFDATDANNEHDYLIGQYVTRLAIDYIERKNPRTQDERDRVSCLKLLMMHRDVFGAKKYISAKELINHLQVGRDKPINEQHFRSTVIGRLRDEGILIASSSKGELKGYRLPTSASELLKFLEHSNSQILPMLNRIKICRDQVKLATAGKFDILEGAVFNKLRSIIDEWIRLV